MREARLLPAGRIVLPLLIAVWLLTGIAAARYAAVATLETDTQIAAFAMDAGLSGTDSLLVDFGAGDDTAFCELTIRNEKNGKCTQVDVEYRITIILSEPCQGILRVAVDDASYIVSEDQLTYTFSAPEWTVPADIPTEVHHTIFFFPEEDAVSEDIVLDIQSVSVIAEQID